MDTQQSFSVSTQQEYIANTAYKFINEPIVSLNHYLNIEWLKEAFRRTRKDGACGIDGVTAMHYEAKLEENLQDLINRAHSGRYVAPPVKRVYIPKAGKQNQSRPIGIPTFEDKVLQRAVVMILEPIVEAHFCNCSYGFRPGRSAHQAINKVWSSAMKAQSAWVIDIDIEGFFDNIDKKILQDLLSKWVADGVIRRLVGKWLNAGVMDKQQLSYPDKGTPQGGVISPLLSNLFLHHVLDSWFEHEVQHQLKYKAELIRFADDAIIVFNNKADAHKVFGMLPKRFEEFGLRLHPEKTKLIRFHKPNEDDDSKLEPRSFDFLGFTHYWGKSKKGNWVVKQKTMGIRLSRAVRTISDWCRLNRHLPLPEQQRSLARKLLGHFAYFGIAHNFRQLSRFHMLTERAWYKWLCRRSTKSKINWEEMHRLLRRYPLPRPYIVHPYASKAIV
jgi:group II intron reverse transcriptase/maturase